MRFVAALYCGLLGNGGQRILIVPDFDIVVVTTAGFYNGNDQPADDVALAVAQALLP